MNPHCTPPELEAHFESTAMYELLDTHQNTIRLVLQVPKMPAGTPRESAMLHVSQISALHCLLCTFIVYILNVTEALKDC